MREPAPVASLAETVRPTNLNQQLVWDQFKDELALPRREFRYAWSDAKGQYVGLPYHNFDHAKEVMWDSLALGRLCIQNGIAVNTRVLAMASLYHDAGFHIDISDTEFESKEHYAAAIYQHSAPSFGFDEAEVELGSKLIIATKLGTKRESVEERIIVRADIDNVGGNYDISFRAKSGLLIEEERLLAQQHGKKFNRLQFEANSIKALAVYMSSDLKLGDFDNGQWSSHAAINLQRLAIELARQQNKTLTGFVQGLGSTAVSKLFESLPKRD